VRQVGRAVEAINKIISRQHELSEKRKKYEEGKAQQEAAASVVHVPDVCSKIAIYSELYSKKALLARHVLWLLGVHLTGCSSEGLSSALAFG
jgi:hypothetical protein